MLTIPIIFKLDLIELKDNKMKQGPSFILKDHCSGCCFLKTTQTNGYFCDKLNMRLDVYNNTELPSTNLNCPFTEENLIQFHNESLFKIHENKEEKIKKIIESIFLNFEFHNLTVNEILLTTETITKHHIEKIQKELPDYLYDIYVDDHVNLKLCLTKLTKKV